MYSNARNYLLANLHKKSLPRTRFSTLPLSVRKRVYDIIETNKEYIAFRIDIEGTPVGYILLKKNSRI